ncbi:hypothetical protein V3851_13555 [Paenibacillus sp. M1]|uniref:Uncharacterized protein n=1 Tax=Paenibacillus haidiansis TaxID=1574488 RepID=A0ABU7VSZ0_9BACL
MNQAEMEAFVRQDREDLLAVLEMRFGVISAAIRDEIGGISSLNDLQRLILAACNAADWSIFAEELEAGRGTFKLTGERFNPAGNSTAKGASL